MCLRVVVLTVVCAVIPRIGVAQNLELVYTPAVLQEAVALKDTLNVALVHASSALSMVGASAERRKAYCDKVASTTAVVILGEDALKALADVEFSVPVILINASGRTAAKSRIVRVFDGAAPADAVPVASSGTVTEAMAGGRDVSLKGPVGPVVQAVLRVLK
jgi:hypothetical protein